MLAKSYRLSRQAIERLYKKGDSFRQGSLWVKFGPNRTDHCRFAAVIAKKVLAQATDRNKVRRFIYNWLGRNVPLWQGKKNDFMISLKERVSEAQLEIDLARVFDKVK